MAGFSFKKIDLSCTEEIKHLEVFDIPLNVSGDIIGEGSSAVVFKHTLREKTAAVKKFKQMLSKKAILKAANALLKLKHENICRFRGYSLRPSALLFEYCQIMMDEDSHCIVNDLKQLVTLFNDHDYFSFSERKDYCFQICNGLDYLHSMGVIHKDLKPSNVLVNGSKEHIQLKISDFSEVAVFKDTILTTLTKNPLLGTTLAYISPELIKGDSEGSTNSDIYALGITMFEVLSNLNSPWDGVIPFFTDIVLKDKILSGQRPNVNNLKELYGEEANQICCLISTCWSDNPYDRPNATQALEVFQSKVEDAVATVRRSARKREPNTPCDAAKHHIRSRTNPDHIEKHKIDDVIGFGVFATRLIKKDEFIGEYIGERISAQEGEKRLGSQDSDSVRSFLYFFAHQKKNYCIDATKNNKGMAKYINDSQKGRNCQSKVIVMEDGTPHLCIFALKDIPEGMELRYDYVEKGLFWRNNSDFKKYKNPLSKNSLQFLGQDLSIGSEENTQNVVDSSCCPRLMEEPATRTSATINNAEKVSEGQEVLHDDPTATKRAVAAKSPLCTIETRISTFESDGDCEGELYPEEVDFDVNMDEAPRTSNLKFQLDGDTKGTIEKNEKSKIIQLPTKLRRFPNRKKGKVDVQSKKTTQSEDNYTNHGSVPVKQNDKVDVHFGKKGRPYQKPYRTCPFCGRLWSKLTSHIQNCHKDNPRVKAALRMTKKTRINEFKKMKREGIVMYNKKQAQKKIPLYQSERIKRKYKAVMLCSTCSATISKKFFYSHRRNCIKSSDQVPVAVPLLSHSGKGLSDEFLTTVLSKVREDDIGKVVRNDEFILYLGNKFHNKLKHKKEKLSTVGKSVRSDMRTLASLYTTLLSFTNITKIHNNLVDMFLRDNFHSLSDAVDSMTTKEDKTMKAGLRQNLFFLLLKSCKHIRDRLFLEKQEEYSRELDCFYQCLKSNQDILLGSAQYQLENTKLKKTRKPCSLPVEEDIAKLHKYVLGRMECLCGEFEFWSAQTFIELRNLTMVRLTLLNARRGGEVGRLQMEDWLEAKNNGWIDRQRLESLSEADRILVNSMKIAYQTGKGNRHLVSLLIPKDTVPAMNILSDADTRQRCGVSKTNTFVFASTQLSQFCFSGWHALKDICKKVLLSKPNLLNATNNRHRVSTLYAALNLSERERELFYKHMGHSAEMNQHVYQAPLAVMGITKVGRNLMQIEAGTDELQTLDPSDLSGDEEEVAMSPKRKNVSAENDTDDEYLAVSGSKENKMQALNNIYSDSQSDDETLANSAVPRGKRYPSRRARFHNSEKFSNKGSSEENGLQVKKSAKWTTEMCELFTERFGVYVRREGGTPFPSKPEMISFIQDIGNPFGVSCVRNKINNERAKFDEIKAERLRSLGLTTK